MEPTDSEFMRELMTVFCGEAEERLATVDQRLLAIEQTHQMDQRTDLLADLIEYLLHGDDDGYESEIVTNKPSVGSPMP